MDDRSPTSLLRGSSTAAGSRTAWARASSADYEADFHDVARLRYRCELRRRAEPEPRQVSYDGGEYSPYCLDSLADLLHREAMLPHSALEVRIDLAGPCPGSVLRDMTLRFSSLGIARLRVLIHAEGHDAVIIGAAHASSGDEPLASSPSKGT